MMAGPTTEPSEALILDPELGAVARNGEEVRLTRKATEVLLCLDDAEGRVVGREELVACVWSGMAVSDQVVSTVIYELRRALGDDARVPRFIETIRKGGYRWLGGRVAAGDPRPSGPGTVAAMAIDPRACASYLKGLHLARQGTRRGVERGIEHLRDAAARDPGFALAQVALADVYAGDGGDLLGLPPAMAYREADRALVRALEIDPYLPAAHAALAALRYRYGWDWLGAESGFRRARELSTCDPSETDLRYAEYLSAVGRHEEAIAALEEVVATRPLDVSASWTLARALYLSRHFAGSLARLADTIELDPRHAPTHRLLAEVHARLGHEAAAYEALLAEARLRGASPSSLVALEESFRRSGLHGVRRWQLAAGGAPPRLDPVERARVLAALGQVDRSLDALEEAYRGGRAEVVWVGVDPAFDVLRGERRFVGLLRALRLPASSG
jgi:DNA-binding winged helix-turn-helix (wHTH) protein